MNTRFRLPFLLIWMAITIISAVMKETQATVADATTTTSTKDTTTTSGSECSSSLMETVITTDILQAFERLDKWTSVEKAPSRFVYSHNKARAAATGFPTRLQTGQKMGLSDYETAAIFGWTTGDYRLVNPVARQMSKTDSNPNNLVDFDVEFQDYPFLPYDTKPVTCQVPASNIVPYVHVLQSALFKLPPLLDSRERLWRGHARQINSSIGSLVSLPGFNSVTRDRDTALQFAARANHETSSPQRTLVCILQHASARCISKLSARPQEYEVLFPLDRTFEVVPPPESWNEDQAAVQNAVETLQKSVPEADIHLVYVQEVGRPSASDGTSAS